MSDMTLVRVHAERGVVVPNVVGIRSEAEAAGMCLAVSECRQTVAVIDQQGRLSTANSDVLMADAVFDLTDNRPH